MTLNGKGAAKVADTRTGQCLCGAVSFTASVDAGIQACHCQQCQRWTGGGPLYSVRVKDLEIVGADQVMAFHASDWGERGVCATCGSTLYWKSRGEPISFLTAGLLDDQSSLSVTEEIFVDYRPDWLAAVPGASQSTEAQELAKLQEYLAGKNT